MFAPNAKGWAMKTVMRATWMAAALVAALPAAAQPQRPGEITFYSNIAFKGQSYTVTGPRENIRIPWTARSARISGGGAWEVCPRTGYGGACNRVKETQGNIAWTVGSARPIGGGPGPGPRPPVPPPPPAGGNSLRGMSAEFFTAPSDRGQRVESCRQGTAACAADAADRFCRSRGWTASSYERQETVFGRNYLADVLCTRTR